MNIYFASDHAGFELKNHLLEFVQNLGFTASDKGPLTLDPSDDYPDYISLVTEEILKNPDTSLGIVLGGSGQGEAMMANRFKGIRATVYYGGAPDILKLSKEHNNANVLSLGARFLSHDEAQRGVKLWLESEFPGDERHKRRIEKLDK